MPSSKTSSPLNFQDLFNASPNAYVLLDTDLTIVEANETYLETVGRDREEIKGKSMFDAFPGNPDRSEGPNVRRLRASFERVLSTGQQDSLALIPYAIPQETGEGTTYEQCYWSATHTPIFDEDGTVEYILQHTTDVTELYEQGYYEEESQATELPSPDDAPESKRDSDDEAPTAEGESDRHTPTPQQVEEGILTRAEAVQKAYWNSEKERERLRRLFDQTPGFMAFLRGPDHVFEMANEAYYQLVGHRDILGKPVREALPEVIEQGFPELLTQVYESGEPYVGREVEIRLQQAPGADLETVYLDFIYQPVTGPEGDVVGIFVQGHDVTEKKEAKDRLRQQKNELEQLTETLEKRVEERTQQVRELTSQVTRIEQQERQRIGQDLHDSTASQLTGATLLLSTLSNKVQAEEAKEGLQKVQEIIEESADDVRRLSRGLNPGGLSEGDLPSALEGLTQSIEGARFENAPDQQAALDGVDLEEEVATHLYRIAQEAASNAKRHSTASTIEIRLRTEDGALLLEVEDDGEGFDPDEISEGLGFRSMQRRADFLGATLTVETNHGGGTLVRCKVPT